MVVWMMACFPALIHSSVFARDVSPVADDRVDFSVDSAVVPQVENSSDKTAGWDIGALISAAYDSNIFLSASDPASDTVYRLGPVIGYKRGDAVEGRGGCMKAVYQPTAVVYAKNESESRIDHVAAIRAGWRGQAALVTYTGGLRKLGDATADTGQATDRIEMENELRVGWIPREKVTLEAAVGNNRTAYEDDAFFDSSKTYGEVAVRYAYSPKTGLGLAYQAGRFEVDGASAQTTQQVTANLSWQPRAKIRIDLNAGAGHRDTDNGPQVNPVLDGRIDLIPREGTGFYLTVYQREEASAFFSGQNYSVKGVTAGVSQCLGGNLTARLEGGRESTSYSRVSGSGSSGRDDRIGFVRPALEYRISDDLDLALYYRASENRSNNASFGCDRHVAGMELNYQF
jgi:hypothetical protein